MNNTWHYADRSSVTGKVLVQVNKRADPVEINEVYDDTDIETIEQALAFILKYPHNLMRVSGYKCSKHKKVHKFTFHSQVSFTWPFMKGVDTEQEVIDFARSLQKKKVVCT